MSEILTLIERQRAALLAKESSEMLAMTRRWMQMEKALEAEMLKTVMALGEEGITTEAMILRSEHFQKLMWQARAEFAKYADYVEDKVTQMQKNGLAIGLKDAGNVLEMAIAEARMTMNFEMLNVNAIEAMFGMTADGTPLRSLLMKSYGEATTGILDALVEGLAKGWGAKQTAESMANGFSIGLQRAVTIARTELMRAYRLGSQQQYANSGVVVQYKRMAVKDDKTCLGCLFADGETFDNADEFADHPNGRCVIIPIVIGTEAPTWETGMEWFTKQDEAKQREILGDTRFELWQNGTPLSEMSKFVDDPTWGGSFVPTPVGELQG